MTELEQTVADRKLFLEARLEAIAGTRRLCVIEEDGVREELAEIAAFSELLDASKRPTVSAVIYESDDAANEVTHYDRIIAVLVDRGAMKGADIAAAIGLPVNHTGALLYHLRRRGKVVHAGNLWGARNDRLHC